MTLRWERAFLLWHISLVSSNQLSSLQDCDALANDGAFKIYTLENELGSKLSFIPFGGTVTNFIIHDSNGSPVDVVLGFDDPRQYCANESHPYFGALIGRVANRISNGKFHLNGNVYSTPINEPAGNDTLHGGTIGFDRRTWFVVLLSKSTAMLTYRSPDGEMGFPGDLQVRVTYTLDDDNTWHIDYSAVATEDTVVALSQHTYWNLNGAKSNILDHVVHMPNAGHYIQVDKQLIPTGVIGDTSKDFWLDFTKPKCVGKDISLGTVTPSGGYDNAFVLDGWAKGKDAKIQATVSSKSSGIKMEVYTDQPSLQMYSGNFLDGTFPVKKTQGAEGYYEHWGALVFEAQHYPDSVNHPDWPSVILKQGEMYRQRTSYRLSNMERMLDI